MSIEIGTDLAFVLKQISSRCESKDQIHRFEFMELLKCLGALETSLVAKYFCKLSWNIGSLHTLGVLQELRILTATEYILCQANSDHIQLILNDFLEAEYQLVVNLFINSYYDTSNSVKLTSLVDECLRRLFTDLLQNPNLNSLDYLETSCTILPVDLRTKLAQKHINIILDLHSSNVKEAFRNFSNWINEGVDDIKFTKDLYEKLLSTNQQESISHLFKLSTSDHFKEWKFYLILLQTIASHCSSDSSAFIRKYLKTRLRQIATLPSTNSMLHLLLTARAANATTLDIHKNIDAYAIWYKQNIGDIKFVLSTEEFQIILKLLEDCLSYEMEDDYLEVHIAISISPPVLCGKLVQGYKSKCRTRLAQLKCNLKPIPADESIVIDDSD